MTANNIFLVCAALVPAIALCIYIYKKDRAEKEPIGLLLLLLLAGALICFPAAWVESILHDLYYSVFATMGEYKDGMVYLGSFAFRVYNFFDYFMNVALVEEGFKFLALLLITKNNKNFNSMFDGMIYAIFVSIGFAGFENITYVLDYGFEVAVRRAFTAVPGHMFFAAIMGYYYSFWHLSEKVNGLEISFKEIGLIDRNYPESKSSRYLVLSLFMAVLAHGFYDYCLAIESKISVIAFYVFLIFLYFYCFAKIKRFSKKDEYTDNIAAAIVRKKHPNVKAYFEQQQRNGVF